MSRVVEFFRSTAVSAAVAVAAFVLLEVILALFAPQHPRTVRNSGGRRAVEDSVLGHRYRPGTETVIAGPEFDVTYRTNRHGHRDPTPYSPTPSADSVRVLLLGDSFTFGAGADVGEIWPVVAEALLRRRGIPADFVNAGVEGYDTRTEYLLLRRIFDDVQPDVVLIAFLANDIMTNRPLDEPVPPSREIHTGTGGLLSRLNGPVLARRILFANDAVYVESYLRTGRRRFFEWPPSEAAQRRISVTQSLLSDASAFCRARGVPLVVLSIPQLFQVIVRARGFERQGIDVGAVDDELAAFARAEGIEWIPVLDALSGAMSRGGDLYHRLDGHLTADGNAVVAGVLADSLQPLLSRRMAGSARAAERGAEDAEQH